MVFKGCENIRTFSRSEVSQMLPITVKVTKLKKSLRSRTQLGHMNLAT